MKKLIIFAGAMLLLAAGTVGFFASRPMSAQEALILKNVAAIAQGEGGSSNNWACWSQEKKGTGYWRCGDPCQWVDGAGGKGTEGKCYSK